MAPAGRRSRRDRWWHRGPFVRREVRLSVGTVLVFLFFFYVAIPLLASHRSQISALAHINIGLPGARRAARDWPPWSPTPS